MENSLVEGRINKTLLYFSLPFLIANFLQAVYGAADLYVVGIYSNAAAVSGVAIGSQILNMITSIIAGFAMGGTVLIGHKMGQRDEKQTAEAIGTLAVVFFIVSIFITIVMYINVDKLVSLMNTPLDATKQARDYLGICILGIPFITGYNAVSAIFRGLGDSKTPVYFVAIACIINIIVDLLLVAVFKFDAAGAAFATSFSQAISFLLGIIYMKYKGLKVPFNLSFLKIEKLSLIYILRVGFPIALQGFLVSVSFLIITAIINTLGVNASASVGVVQKIIGFAMLPPMSFAAAVATMTAQNIGAGKPERALQSLRSGIVFSLIFGVSVCLYSQFWPETITGLFTNDPVIIKMSAQYLQSFSIDCILVSFVFCMNSYFNGCGKSLVSFAHSIISTFLVRIPMSFFLSIGTTTSLYKMGLAAPLATLLSLVICLIYFKIESRKTLV